MYCDIPIAKPPIVLNNVPITLIPPFVPFGTFLKVVTRYGSESEKTVPSSDAQVSPLQQAKTPEIKIFYYITT